MNKSWKEKNPLIVEAQSSEGILSRLNFRSWEPSATLPEKNMP